MSSRYPLFWVAAMLWSLSCAMALSGCIVVSGRHEEARFTGTRALNVAHRPETSIYAESGNGSLSITKADVAEVQITAEFRCVSRERLDAVSISAVREGDGKLRIVPVWPGGEPRSSEACSFAILVPDARGVEAVSSNGDIVLAGLAGEARAESSNGQISVMNQDGPVHAGTRNGKVTITRPAGDVFARTSNGAVVVESAKGKVDASTTNGGIRVELDDASTGPLKLESSNGSVEVVLGSRFAGEMDVTASNGHVNVASAPAARLLTMERGHARLIIGEGKALSHLRTSNGSIDVRHR